LWLKVLAYGLRNNRKRIIFESWSVAVQHESDLFKPIR